MARTEDPIVMMKQPRGAAYAEVLLQALNENNVTLVTGLPDSLLKSFYRLIEKDQQIRYIPVTNESEMPGIVVGAYLGGKRALMVMENSGLRQAYEPIARFVLLHQFPLVMVLSHRGDLGEPHWWGHSHAQTMEPLLDALHIPYRYVRHIVDIEGALGSAFRHADSGQCPVALIFEAECTDGMTK